MSFFVPDIFVQRAYSHDYTPYIMAAMFKSCPLNVAILYMRTVLSQQFLASEAICEEAVLPLFPTLVLWQLFFVCVWQTEIVFMQVSQANTLGVKPV